MNGLHDREEAFESKFAHEEQVGFDVEARASKLFGLWAAAQLGFDGAESEAYAKSLVTVNLEEPGFDDVLRKVRADFDEKGLEISDHILKVEMDKALGKAEEQVRS